MSALLLVYSALLVPVQLSFWLSDDPCYLYPTVRHGCARAQSGGARCVRCGGMAFFPASCAPPLLLLAELFGGSSLIARLSAHVSCSSAAAR